MKNYIAQFLNTYNFPIEAKSSLLFAFDSLGETNIIDICSEYYQNRDFCVLTEKMHALTKNSNIHEYTVRLLIIIALTKRLKDDYISNGINEDVYVDTMRDLLYKYNECKSLHGIDGTFEWEWYKDLFELNFFVFGRLEFKVFKFRLDSYTKNDKTITLGETVLDVHIPSTGTPLTNDACELSYAMARKFFHNRLGFDAPFVCWSWLLYGKNKEFLSPNSNILAFSTKFDVIEEEEYSDEGFNASVAWRIFNVPKIDKIENLPRNTSMQRRIADYLQKGNKLGWGYGIFF